MTQATQIKNSMNEFGKQKKPFLFAIDYKLDKGIFIDNPEKQSDILFVTPLGTNKSEAIKSTPDNKLEIFPITFGEYKKRFDNVMKSLKRGDTYLVNLTARTPIKINVELKDIFMSSNSPYGLLFPGNFVCFSPERFVKISNGVISTNPMKGTISADIPNAEKLILENEKEAAEHATVVDLLRNDLSLVAENVTVEKYRYIDKIKTNNGNLLQVSSEIKGKLPADYHSRLGDIIFGLLPAGSICGAPKKSTLEIISNAEQYDRGYYTGIFGYFNGNELDSGVLIRFIGQENDKTYFYSGGGITSKSNLKNEYEELLKKIYLPFQ